MQTPEQQNMDSHHDDEHHLQQQQEEQALSFQRPQFQGEYIESTGFYQALKLDDTKPIVSKQSEFQMIEVYQTKAYGKIMLLDGAMQITERDGNAYNEMMAHVPLFAHRNPRRVLVIGGGDGYVVSEILKHSSVEHVDHVELDREVVNTCRQVFSWGKYAWEDEQRVHLHFLDGAQFVQDAPDQSYDVIIQDTSDPWYWDSAMNTRVPLPAGAVYTPDHFANLQRILTKDGVFCLQAESIQIPNDLHDIVEWRETALDAGFNKVRYGSIIISSYPTGQIGFLLCEKKRETDGSLPEVKQRYAQLIQTQQEQQRRQQEKNGIKYYITSYYHPRLQKSAFECLPMWAEQAIYGPVGLDGDFMIAKPRKDSSDSEEEEKKNGVHC